MCTLSVIKPPRTASLSIANDLMTGVNDSDYVVVFSDNTGVIITPNGSYVSCGILTAPVMSKQEAMTLAAKINNGITDREVYCVKLKDAINRFKRECLFSL